MNSSLSTFGLPYWLDLERPHYPHLQADLSADAVVIGAGICGLKLARALAQQGLKTVILEGGRVGEGASSRNQGSANHGPGASYSECIRRYGHAQTIELWRLGLENQRMIADQIAEYAIGCDYQMSGFTALARRDMPDWETTLASYQHDSQLLQQDGFDVERLDEEDAYRVTGNRLFVGGHNHRRDTQFHSGRYVIGLARGVTQSPHVQLFENARVLRIQRTGTTTSVITANATVSTPLVFMGLNALTPQHVPDLEAGLRAERGQVFVTEPLTQRPCWGSFGTAMAWWREINEADGRYRLLFGGGRKREEPDSLFPQFTAEGQPHPQLEGEGSSPSIAHQRRLDEQFALIFPSLVGVKISHRWGGLQSFTADDLPQMGLLDEERQIWGVAGFCGRGNCYSDVGASYVVGKVLGIPRDVEKEFGGLIEASMAVRRSAAIWSAWESVYR